MGIERINMKKTNVEVKLNWIHCWGEGVNVYESAAGNYSATVMGKYYKIYEFSGDDNLCVKNVFKAKARSNKDAFQRAANKLIKFAIIDQLP